MRAVPFLIAAIVVLALGLVLLLVGPSLRLPGGGGLGGTVDSSARIEIERLRFQIEALQTRTEDLEDRLRSLENAPITTAPVVGDQGYIPSGPNDIIDDYGTVVLIPNRRDINAGVDVASPDFLVNFLGSPRETLSDNCEPMTNPRLRDMLRVESVGPIRVNMLEPAIESLRRVFARIEEVDRDLYARIKSSGSLCVRRIRGTQGRVSTHAFGLAVDLNIDGQLDNFADGRTQLGLIIMADFFKDEGWVWGAGFGREDSMHFEVSRQQLEAWREAGRI